MNSSGTTKQMSFTWMPGPTLGGADGANEAGVLPGVLPGGICAADGANEGSPMPPIGQQQLLADTDTLQLLEELRLWEKS